MAVKDSILTLERLKELLHYDPETGYFYWATPRQGARLNKAAGYTNARGYTRIRIDGRAYHASRLAWFYMTGSWPNFEVDHIDTNSANNAWANLRDVTRELNAQNKRRARFSNMTNLIGVSKTESGRYKAILGLGTFDTPQAAHDAYISAKRMFHPGNTL